MLGLSSSADNIVAAINATQAVIQFSLDGIIQSANDNFLNVMGYSRGEVVGKHHSIFVEPADAQSEQYKMFWQKLREGHSQTAEFKRLTKSGQDEGSEKRSRQFIYISHNKIAMEMAAQLMGVTMQEPGVSRVVAVDVDDAVKMAAAS